MKYLRKSSSIALIILMNFLWITSIYSISPGFSCCSPDDAHDGFNEKHHTDQLSINSKEHPEDNHHCKCKQCDVFNNKKTILFTTYTNNLEKKQILSCSENISELKITLSNGIINFTNNRDFSNFHSLFLLKSSFLL